jgi:tetratricopeptide (TPR) repeat protein
MLTIAMIVSLVCTATHAASLQRMRQTAQQEWARGNLDEAAKQYRQIIDLDRSHASHDAVPAGDLHNLAVLSSEIGLDDAARMYYEWELGILQRHGRIVDAGVVYTALAELSQTSGHFSKAEAEYKRAIATFDHSSYPSDLHVVAALDELGWLYITWGRLEDGSRLLDEARAKAEHSPLSSPSAIRHLDTQAAYRVILGEYTQAQRLWKQALTIGASYYGPQAHEYDNVLMHFGQASVRIGDYKTAEDMLQRYIANEGPASSPMNTTRAMVTSELAHLYTTQHRYPAARSLFEKAVAMMQDAPEKAPLSRSMVFSYFGDYLMAQCDWQAAEQRYRQALTLQQGVLGDTRAVASSMERLSKALRKLHRKNEAEELIAEARRIWVAQPDLPYSRNTVDVQAFRQH